MSDIKALMSAREVFGFRMGDFGSWRSHLSKSRLNSSCSGECRVKSTLVGFWFSFRNFSNPTGSSNSSNEEWWWNPTQKFQSRFYDHPFWVGWKQYTLVSYAPSSGNQIHQSLKISCKVKSMIQKWLIWIFMEWTYLDATDATHGHVTAGTFLGIRQPGATDKAKWWFVTAKKEAVKAPCVETPKNKGFLFPHDWSSSHGLCDKEILLTSFWTRAYFHWETFQFMLLSRFGDSSPSLVCLRRMQLAIYILTYISLVLSVL